MREEADPTRANRQAPNQITSARASSLMPRTHPSCLAPRTSYPAVLASRAQPADVQSPVEVQVPYSTRWEARGVVWKFEGRVTGVELLNANHEIYGDSRFDQMAYQIVDLTEVERFDVTEEDMIVIAANDRAAALSRADVKVAIATRNEIVRQLSLATEEGLPG